MKAWTWKRHLVQLAFIALLIGGRFGSLLFFGSLSSTSILGISLADPLAGIQVLLASRSFYLPLILSFLPILVVYIILGRAFCSWICPINTIFELLPLDNKKVNYFSAKPRYLILILLLLGTFLVGVPLFELITPINIFVRALLFTLGPEILIVLSLIILEIFKPRLWCASLCPLGAFYSLVGNKRLLRLQVNQLNCTKCKECEISCTWGKQILEPLIKGRENRLSAWACTNCGKCIEACSEAAINFSFGNSRETGEVVINR